MLYLLFVLLYGFCGNKFFFIISFYLIIALFTVNAQLKNGFCYEDCLTECYTMTAIPEYWCPNLCKQHCAKQGLKCIILIAK